MAKLERSVSMLPPQISAIYTSETASGGFWDYLVLANNYLSYKILCKLSYVVFDRRYVHQRRAKGQAGVAVTFTEDTKFTMKKGNFLANPTNKQQFINILANTNKCKVYHDPRNVDVLIVQKRATFSGHTDVCLACCYPASLEYFFWPCRARCEEAQSVLRYKYLCF